MSRLFAASGLLVLGLAIMLAGCTMTDALSWFATDRIVEVPASAITPLPSSNPPATPCQRATGLPFYVVVQGDTLAGIAESTGSTAAELALLNCLSDMNRIVAGQTLQVPRAVAPLPTLSPAETPAATATAPRVVRFTADLPTVQAGGAVTLTWEIENAESALLRLLYPGGVIVEYGEVPVAGNMTVDIPSDATGTLTAQLIPSPLPERGAFGTLEITIAEGSAQEVVITRFMTSSTEARPGDTVTLSWSVSGAPGVSLVIVKPDGSLGPTYSGLPAEGAQTFTFPDGVTGTYGVQLWPLHGTLARVMSEVTVSVSE